jgi:hypothetical protein
LKESDIYVYDPKEKVKLFNDYFETRWYIHKLSVL